MANEPATGAEHSSKGFIKEANFAGATFAKRADFAGVFLFLQVCGRALPRCRRELSRRRLLRFRGQGSS
jgi:hypothetical protein